jgi:hypothetical protein
VDFVLKSSDQQALLLQFKQNAMTALPAPVPSTPELETALNSAEGV